MGRDIALGVSEVHVDGIEKADKTNKTLRNVLVQNHVNVQQH